MRKGLDYTGVNISFHCHDGEGNYVICRRNQNCRDEHGCWDFGGGGLKFNESLLDGVKREVMEEYGVEALKIEFLGFDEIHREHEGERTHWLSFRHKVLVDRDKVINNEPDKHEDLKWVTINNLPAPLHSQLENVIHKYHSKL